MRLVTAGQGACQTVGGSLASGVRSKKLVDAHCLAWSARARGGAFDEIQLCVYALVGEFVLWKKA